MNNRYELISIDKVDDLLEFQRYPDTETEYVLHEGGYRVRIMEDDQTIISRYFRNENEIGKLTLEEMVKDKTPGMKVDGASITEERVCYWITTGDEYDLPEVETEEKLLENTLNVVALLGKHGLWTPDVMAVVVSEYRQVCRDWFED